MINAQDGSVTAAWMQKWKLTGTLANPSYLNSIPTKIAYIRHYAIDMAYITSTGSTESLKQLKQQIYGMLQKMAMAACDNTEMRITRKYPYVSRKQVWTNLHKAWISETIKVVMVHGDT
jgi:hypothetical protein